MLEMAINNVEVGSEKDRVHHRASVHSMSGEICSVVNKH